MQQQHILKNVINPFHSNIFFKSKLSSAFLFPAYFSQSNFPHISNISQNWQFPAIFFSIYASNFKQKQFIVSKYQTNLFKLFILLQANWGFITDEVLFLLLFIMVM